MRALTGLSRYQSSCKVVKDPVKVSAVGLNCECVRVYIWGMKLCGITME